MPRLIFWRIIALITSGLLHIRVLLIILLLTYVVGWIVGWVYGRGF